jgi:two-component system chemotaxis response regulator CheB
MVTDVLSADPQIEIAGTAANGRIALAKIAQLVPDVVTLDIEMPEMDGLQTLRELRVLYPKLPVIMFSTLTERGGAATLDALTLGANDYVTKPANVGSVTTAIQRVREQLIPKVKALCPLLAPPPHEATSPALRAPSSPPFSGPRRVSIVAIGTSTGGPNALAALFAALPTGFSVPIVIVQHMPPMFTRLLAQRLAATTPHRVREAAAGAALSPGDVWIAPGDHHLEVVREAQTMRLAIHQGPPENSCRPAVDPLFRSVAAVYGNRALAVILTGMGQDGLRGCQAIRAAGGQILAQDEASSVVWGMPGFVARAGLADRVLPLDRVAAELSARAAVGRPFTGPGSVAAGARAH